MRPTIPALKAGVAWYGRLVGEADELHPKHPIDVVSSIKAPILGLYGEADQGIPGRLGREDAGRPSRRPARPPRSSSTPILLTPSSPIIGPATARTRPRTAGSACSTGSRSMAWRKPTRSMRYFTAGTFAVSAAVLVVVLFIFRQVAVQDETDALAHAAATARDAAESHLKANRFEAAEDACRKAFSFLDMLADRSPAEPRYRRERAAVAEALATCLVASGARGRGRAGLQRGD